MTSTNDRKRPRLLSVGEQILLVREGDDLRVAVRKRHSFVAQVVAQPEVAQHPDGGDRRSGWAIDTNEGLVSFVAGVANVMLANEEDKLRDRKRRAQAKDAARDGASVLGGLTTSRPAAGDRRNSVVSDDVAQLAAAEIERLRTTPAVGKAAAQNYRALADACDIPRARAYWFKLAADAERGV